MNVCVFCKIVAHEAPASIVYEDNKVLCFMDVRPVNDGACMVIPKVHIDHFTDIDDELASHILVLAQSVGRRILKELSPQRIGYVVHGYGVAHAHLNIVPQHGPDDIAVGKTATIQDGNIIFDHNILSAPDRTELDRIANLIK